MLIHLALQTNARLGQYVGFDAWNHTTKAGVTIQAAADYAMLQPAGSETASELYPDVAAVGAIYGDPSGKYAAWLNTQENSTYVADATFFWDQPLGDSGFAAQLEAAAAASSASAAAAATATAPTGTQPTNAKQQNTAFGQRLGAEGALTRWLAFYGVCSFVMAASLVEFF